MRRFLFPLMSLGFLAFTFGCTHVAGVCDCEVGRNWCAFAPHGPAATIQPATAFMPGTPVPGTAVPITPEPIKEQPKELPKEPPMQ
jgi:hypothetical protein